MYTPPNATFIVAFCKHQVFADRDTQSRDYGDLRKCNIEYSTVQNTRSYNYY